MANPISFASDLVNEVINIIRVDNAYPRAYEWLGLAFNDICQRTPVGLFHEVSVDTITTGNDSVTLGEQVGTPVAAIFVNADTKLYMAHYRTPADFDALTKIGSSISAAVQPKYWTIKLDGTTYSLFISPPASGSTIATLIWSGNYSSTVPTGATQFNIPYHFEQVLVWGAATFGALSGAMDRYMVCKMEYEEALKDMYTILMYHPDSASVVNQIKGPYVNTGLESRGARWPETALG